MFAAKFAHLARLVGANFQIRAWLACTKQNKTCFTIFRKVAYRIRLIYGAAVDKTSRARQTASLMAQRRQGDTRIVSCVPDVLIRGHLDPVFAMRRDQCDIECGMLRIGHSFIVWESWLRRARGEILPGLESEARQEWVRLGADVERGILA